MSTHYRFKERSSCLLLIFSTLFLSTNPLFAQKSEETLQSKIAQMLLIGFRGTTLNESEHITKDIKDLGIGGVILFEYDSPSKSRPRNISSATQLKKLITDLQSFSEIPLWVSIDQEGGHVNRLKSQYGFPNFVSPQYLGKINNEDSTRFQAQLTAKTLSSLGFNLNFAPCVDLNVNPDCPIIGKIGRSFSRNPNEVAKHAAIWIEEQRKENIISCLKHFPGHGSSKNDTHLGIADVSQTWIPEELIPYKKLIENNTVEMVMTSHVFNSKLDDTYPATLSEKIITGMLKVDLGYKGIIVTDDLAMGAMAAHYSLEFILKQAILAGADLLCLSNNGSSYDPEIASKAATIISKLVEAGEISEERINQSYEKLISLKRTVCSF